MPFGIPQYVQCIPQGLTSVLLCVHSSLLTVKSVDLVVACDVFLFVMEIVHIFHSDYLEYRGAFQIVLDLYCCVMNDGEGKWILQFQTITGVHVNIVFFIVTTLIRDILFEQFLICTAV